MMNNLLGGGDQSGSPDIGKMLLMKMLMGGDSERRPVIKTAVLGIGTKAGTMDQDSFGTMGLRLLGGTLEEPKAELQLMTNGVLIITPDELVNLYNFCEDLKEAGPEWTAALEKEQAKAAQFDMTHTILNAQ